MHPFSVTIMKILIFIFRMISNFSNNTLDVDPSKKLSHWGVWIHLKQAKDIFIHANYFSQYFINWKILGKRYPESNDGGSIADSLHSWMCLPCKHLLSVFASHLELRHQGSDLNSIIYELWVLSIWHPSACSFHNLHSINSASSDMSQVSTVDLGQG